MPVSYAIDVPLARVRTRCVGHTTLEETLVHFAALSQDPACPPVADVLLDLVEVTSTPPPEKLRELARAAGSVPRVSFRHVAIIASRDALVGMMEMLRVYAQKSFAETAIFATPEEGEAWLDWMRDQP